VRHSAPGRVAKLAHQMHRAGITPDVLVKELPAVVSRYAAWRRVMDLGTITMCWAWILTPPATVEDKRTGSFALAKRATEGGKHPWM